MITGLFRAVKATTLTKRIGDGCFFVGFVLRDHGEEIMFF